MLRASAVLLSGGAAGALATGVASERVTAAEADTGLSVEGDDVTVRDGALAALWLDLTVQWSYAVPSGERPERVVVDVLAGTSADDLTVVDSIEDDAVFLESSGEDSVRVDLLDAGVVSADGVVPTEGGETAETTIHVGVEQRVIDESGLVIAADSQTDTATLAIEKSDYDPDEYGTVSGSGSLTVELE
jgi:hypothetical protein